jgi:hypothetical protein
MGSGHFLVEVVDYVANRLITFLNGWSDNPVWAMLKTILCAGICRPSLASGRV